MTYIPSNVGIQKPASSKALDVAGDVNIDSATASVSSSTGALTVTGGLGVGGDLYVGGSVTFTSATFQNMAVRGTASYNPATATQRIIQSTVSTDTNPKFYIDGNGKHFWGAGALSSVYDVDISRTSAGVLSLTGSLSTSANITASGSGSFNSISASTTLNVTGASTLSGNVTTSGTFIGSYNTQTVMLKSVISGSDKFSLNSDGYMTWGGTNLTLGANADSDFNNNPVFSVLNSSGRVMLKNGTAKIQSTSLNNFTYSGTHTFANGFSSSQGVSVTGDITVKNSSSTLNSVIINNAGSIDFHDPTTGAFYTKLYTDSNGLKTDRDIACSGLTATGTVNANLLRTSGAEINNASMSMIKTGNDINNVGINMTSSTTPFPQGFMGTNSTGTGFSFKSGSSDAVIEIVNPTTSGANLTITAAGLTAPRTLTVPDGSGTILSSTAPSTMSSKIVTDLSLAYTQTTIASGSSVVVDPNNYGVLYITSSSDSSIKGIRTPTFPVVSPATSSVRTLKIVNTSNSAVSIIPNDSSVPSSERIFLTVSQSSISPNGGSMVLTWSPMLGQWYQDGSSANGYSSGREEGAIYEFITMVSTTSLPRGSVRTYDAGGAGYIDDIVFPNRSQGRPILQGSSLINTSLPLIPTVSLGTSTSVYRDTLYKASYNGIYSISMNLAYGANRAVQGSAFLSTIGLMSGNSTFSVSSRRYHSAYKVNMLYTEYPESNFVSIYSEVYLRAGQLFCPYWAYILDTAYTDHSISAGLIGPAGRAVMIVKGKEI